MSDFVRLFIDAWTLFARRFPSPLVEEADGITCCFGNVPLIFFNLWVQNRPASSAEDFRALLRTAAERASACPHPVGGVLRQDWLPAGWEDLLQEAGLEPMMAMTGMDATGILPPRRPLPELEIRRVVDDTTARDLAEVNAHAYGLPPEHFDCMFNMRLWKPDSYGYVGYLNRRAVASAAALPVGGTVYIALVATMPDAQRKGYADAVMRHAIAQGQQAMDTAHTTLHATDMGQPVYRKMGFASGPKFMLIGPRH